MDCEQSSSTAQKQRKVMWAEKKKQQGSHTPLSDRLEQARRRKIWKAMSGLSCENEF